MDSETIRETFGLDTDGQVRAVQAAIERIAAEDAVDEEEAADILWGNGNFTARLSDREFAAFQD